MSIEIRDVDGGLGNIITAQAIIQEEDLVEALRQHLMQDEEKFRQYRYSISDYTRTIKLDLSNKSLELISQYCNMAAVKNPEAVVAVVTDKELLYSLAQIWDILTEKCNWEKMIFINMQEAKTWISQRVKDRYGIDNLTFK